MTTEPKRIQRRRTAGWKMPDDVVYVGRARGAYGKWGNPIDWRSYHRTVRYTEDSEPYHAHPDDCRFWAMNDFHAMVVYGRSVGHFPGYPTLQEIRDQLAGKTLACWCPEGGPCHGDVLLEIANCSDEQFAEILANHGRY